MGAYGASSSSSWVGVSKMLQQCPEPGCGALTLGGTCVAHDPMFVPTYARGRPLVAAGGGRELATIGR